MSIHKLSKQAAAAALSKKTESTTILVSCITSPLTGISPTVVSSIIWKGIDVVEILCLHTDHEWQVSCELVPHLCLHESDITKSTLILYTSQNQADSNFSYLDELR
jgi:hypothetical protein